MKQFFKFVFATIVGLIVFSFVSTFFLFVGILLMLPSSEPVNQNSVLHIKLEGDLIERSKNDLYSLLSQEESPSIGLDDILSSIKIAKTNSNIKGIYLNPELFLAGYASLNEIRDALTDFKESGKFIIAYSGRYTQGAYYLCSVADMVYLNKDGMVDFRGISASSLFFKNLLDKIGVEMQVVKVGTYKSFTEQFTNKEMSPANREQMTLLTETIWSNIIQDISQNRQISKDSLIHAANELLTFQSPERALKLKMIDELVYPDELENILREYLGIDSKTKISYVKPLDLIDSELSVSISGSKDKIAVIYAVGEIDNGNIDGIQSEKIFNILRNIEKDSLVKAVVLRVNSPGGSAYGSEQIWHAVSLLKKTKPVIVSMGDYAASGGYYISCNATKIVADPNTITGSIGVFGVIPNIEGLMNKVGINHDVVKTNKYADMPNIFRTMTDDERNIMQNYVNRSYDLFLKHCAEGRNMPMESIAKIAEGRVWLATSALEIGLVDKLGSLQDAIILAAEEASIASYDIENYPKKEDWFSQLAKLPQVGIQKLFLGNMLTEERALLNKVYKIDHLQASLPFDVKMK